MQSAEVEVSLSQGNFLNKKQRCLLYVSIAVWFIFPVITVIFIAVPQVEWDNLTVFMMICFNLLFLCFEGILIYIKIKNDRIKKKINLWKEDAVELSAYVEQIDEYRIGIRPKAVKIRVRFRFGGRRYLRESTAKIVGGRKGYLDCYKKYVNRKVQILYSPKYDEVLILKSKCLTARNIA